MENKEKKLYTDPLLEIATFACPNVMTPSDPNGLGDNDIPWI